MRDDGERVPGLPDPAAASEAKMGKPVRPATRMAGVPPVSIRLGGGRGRGRLEREQGSQVNVKRSFYRYPRSTFARFGHVSHPRPDTVAIISRRELHAVRRLSPNRSTIQERNINLPLKQTYRDLQTKTGQRSERKQQTAEDETRQRKRPRPTT